MAYCTPEDVARYVTATAGADVDAAIATATDIVNDYTGERFATTTVNVTAVTNRAGIARLPYSARTITAVTLDGGEVLPDALWSFTAGRNATVRLLGNLPWNILINGREPWADRPTVANVRLTFTGTFGYAQTPPAIKAATAILAAQFLATTGQGTYTDAGTSTNSDHSGIASISVEGYSVTYQADTTTDTGTGSSTVDRLLAPYRRPNTGVWS